MKSLTDELRMCACDTTIARDYVRAVCGSAAAEIERLERLAKEQGQEIAITRERDERLEAENERLREALRSIIDEQDKHAEHLRVILDREPEEFESIQRARELIGDQQTGADSK